MGEKPKLLEKTVKAELSESVRHCHLVFQDKDRHIIRSTGSHSLLAHVYRARLPFEDVMSKHPCN